MRGDGMQNDEVIWTVSMPVECWKWKWGLW